MALITTFRTSAREPTRSVTSLLLLLPARQRRRDSESHIRRTYRPDRA